MKYIYQSCYIFLFTFLGETLARLIPVPFPAADPLQHTSVTYQSAALMGGAFHLLVLLFLRTTLLFLFFSFSAKKSQRNRGQSDDTCCHKTEWIAKLF